MPLKQIKYVLPAEKIDMGGFPVLQALPTQQIDQVDPFLLLHHGKVKYSANRLAKHQGVGPHPHRGFSPVTFVIEGEVHHRDSMGNSRIAGSGDVQWVSAGRGIIHSERPSDKLATKRGKQEIVQIWVNTPADHKMDPPSYQYLSSKEMASFTSEDALVQTNIIAGEMNGQKGRIKSASELLILWTKSEKGGTHIFSIPEGMNTMLYLVSGEMRIGGYGLLHPQHLAIFEHLHDDIHLTFYSKAECIFLAGKPLNEEVVRSGPFVMNSQTEILQALRDYQMGKMGILIEE